MMLIDYWIPQIQEVREFQAISEVEQPEINALDKSVSALPNEIIVDTATAKGLTKYETVLGLPKGRSDEIRRTAIIAKLNSRVPFTYRWLINLLTATLGPDKYNVNLYPEDYHLVINVSDDKAHLIDTLTRDLRAKIPANIKLTITTLNSTLSNAYAGYTLRIADIITI